MKTTEEYLNILRDSKSYLMQAYHITQLGIFGSVARHEQTETSDIDVYFEAAPMGLFTLARLKSELENLLNCNVDRYLFAEIYNERFDLCVKGINIGFLNFWICFLIL